MGILSFLSIGLLLSISFFEKEYAKAMSMRKTDAVVSHTEGSKPNDKTDWRKPGEGKELYDGKLILLGEMIHT